MRKCRCPAHLALAFALLSVGLRTSAESGGSRFVAVIAVVSEYSGSLEKFKFAGVAERIEAALRNFARRRGYTSVETTPILLDGGTTPTTTNILRELKRITTLDSNDAAVFYFLGHGATSANDLRLLTSGAQSVNELADFVALASVLEPFSRSRAGLKLVFVDACQQLAGAQGSNGPPISGAAMERLDEVASKNRGLAIYLSTGKNQLSFTEPAQGGRIGIFTRHVIEALNQPEMVASRQAGDVYAEDLAAHLSTAVADAARKLYPQDVQEPRLVSEPVRGRIFLWRNGAGPQQAPAPSVPPPALVFAEGLKRGVRLQERHVAAYQGSATLLGAADRPGNFARDVAGACLVRDVAAGQVLAWADLATVGCGQP